MIVTAGGEPGLPMMPESSARPAECFPPPPRRVRRRRGLGETIFPRIILVPLLIAFSFVALYTAQHLWLRDFETDTIS